MGLFQKLTDSMLGKNAAEAVKKETEIQQGKKTGQEQDTPIQLGAPASGMIVELSTVSDETFAQAILGDGVAVVPEDGRFYAPADGKLVSMFPTGHAFSIEADNGTEILVHIGFDTVKLHGQYFTIHGKEDQQVKKGDLLVEADLEAISMLGFDITTPMVILNADQFSGWKKEEGKIRAGETILTLTKS